MSKKTLKFKPSQAQANKTKSFAQAAAKKEQKHQTAVAAAVKNENNNNKHITNNNNSNQSNSSIKRKAQLLTDSSQTAQVNSEEITNQNTLESTPVLSREPSFSDLLLSPLFSDRNQSSHNAASNSAFSFGHTSTYPSDPQAFSPMFQSIWTTPTANMIAMQAVSQALSAQSHPIGSNVTNELLDYPHPPLTPGFVGSSPFYAFNSPNSTFSQGYPGGGGGQFVFSPLNNAAMIPSSTLPITPSVAGYFGPAFSQPTAQQPTESEQITAANTETQPTLATTGELSSAPMSRAQSEPLNKELPATTMPMYYPNYAAQYVPPQWPVNEQIRRIELFKQRAKDENQKIPLCRHWSRKGYCRMGSHCKFRHSQQ